MKVELTYLGVSCVHVRYVDSRGSFSLLIDPYFNETAFVKRMHVSGIEHLPLLKQLKVFQEQVSDDEALRLMDHLEPPQVILITHGHADHMAHAPAIARHYGATVFGGKQVLGRAIRMGLPLSLTHDLRAHEELEAGPLTLQTWPERHNPQMLSDLCQKLLNMTPADSEIGHMGYFFRYKNGPAMFHAGDGARPEGFPNQDLALVMLSVDAARGACPHDLLPTLQTYGDQCQYLSLHRFYDALEQNKILKENFHDRVLIPEVGQTETVVL